GGVTDLAPVQRRAERLLEPVRFGEQWRALRGSALCRGRGGARCVRRTRRRTPPGRGGLAPRQRLQRVERELLAGRKGAGGSATSHGEPTAAGHGDGARVEIH